MIFSDSLVPGGYIILQHRLMAMIMIELRKEDLLDAKLEVRNLAGTFFAGSSPLIRPFLGKLAELLPEDKRNLGTGYVFGALRSQVSAVKADSDSIRVESSGRFSEIRRSELETMINEKYPSFGHAGLNLPGLLFLQSGPALQKASIAKLGREHGVKIPDGRRTQRYIFHSTVVSLDVDHDRIRIEFDIDRLPALQPSN